MNEKQIEVKVANNCRNTKKDDNCTRKKERISFYQFIVIHFEGKCRENPLKRCIIN